MKRVVESLSIFVFFLVTSSSSVLAVNPYATSSAVVSATVAGTTFSPPTLISPKNNSTTNNPRESLVWKRPDPLPATSLHHYDLYLNGQIFASSVSDSITTQTYYFYTIRRDGNTFYLEPSTNLAEGYHYWSVTAYNSGGISSSSETYTFYIDSVAPYISLENVDQQSLNWHTSYPNSIPDVSQRDLHATSDHPLLSGKVEPFSNMQISLICPQNIPNCQNQSYLGNYPTGIWQHRFYNLLKNITYTVYLSATDAGGNSTTFPVFYLIYGVVTPTPKATTTPKATVTPSHIPTQTPSPSTLPEPSPEIVSPPVIYTPVPPPIPTPPVFQTATPVTPLNYTIIFLIILVFGLPLHLLLASYGTKIHLLNLFRFLLVLFFPFIGKKQYQTTPFATLELYNPDKLDSVWQIKISDVNGHYSLPSSLLNNIFVKVTATGRYWKNTIIKGNLLPNICLFPILEDPKMTPDRLRLLSLKLRPLPLIVACLTSSIALVIQPNYFYLIYLYLSLQLVFSEYIYPKISR